MTALSFGGGVQSTALYLLACDGRIPGVDLAIMSDTGWESRETSEHVARLQGMNLSVPIEIVKPVQSIQEEATRGGPWVRRDGRMFRTLPLYRREGNHVAMGRRQCSKEYKISPVRKRLRAIDGGAWALHIGISTDEAKRAKPSERKWLTHTFPLLDLGWGRAECAAYCEERLGYLPAKSACLGCPFKGASDWRRLHDEDPEGWRSAVAFDDALRGSGEYLHRSAVPLREALAASPAMPLLDTECVGGCWS